MGRLRPAGRVLSSDLSTDRVGWVLLRNAAAGSDDAERVTAVAGGLARHGPTEVVASDGQADVDEALLGAEGRVVVVCGGDGSVQLAVERARALGLLDDLVLGIVPSGTGNDLAGALDLPTTPVELVELLASSRARTLDLLVTDDDRVVVNAVHVGVGVDAAERASDLKDAAGRLAYPLGAVIAGVSAEGLEVRVEVDGGRVDLDRPALMVVVANGPTIGGGTPVAPAASPDDGQLDVVVVHAVDRTARLAFAAALLRGAHVDREDVVVARGASVTVAGRRLAHNRDGELEAPRGATRGYRVEPRCWRVLA